MLISITGAGLCEAAPQALELVLGSLICICPRFLGKRWIHATRSLAAMGHALGSVALLLCLGVDEGLARFTRTCNGAWQLLAAASILSRHRFWTWAQPALCVDTPEARKTLERVTGSELENGCFRRVAQFPFRRGTSSCAPPPPEIPAPVIHYHGPLSDVLSQAIYAGAPEVGKGGNLLGAQGHLVHGARGTLHSKAVQQGMLETGGGDWIRRALPGVVSVGACAP